MARRNRRRSPPPPFEAVIENLSHEGRGICHHNGKTVFVFNALPGERVEVQIDKSRKQMAEGHAARIIEASPQRVEAHCPHFGVCGGCSLQHLGSVEQIAFKQQSLAEMMAHAGISVGRWMEPLRAEAWGYRRKARLGVKLVRKKGRVLVGFRERSSPFLADMRVCHVLDPRVGKRLDALSELIGGMDASDRIAQIEVACDDDHCALAFRHLDPLSAADRERLMAFARSSGLWIQLQPAGPDSIHPLYPERQPLYFRPLADRDLRIAFKVSDFTQVNADINRQMVARALDRLDLAPAHRVLDLFCGLGNFTLPMARRCASVTGVEGDQAMVDRARENARRLGIDNTGYHAADLTRVDGSEEWLRQGYDRILLDPPRSGAQEIIPHLARLGAGRIVYVSCQPSSLVRDARLLVEAGYRLDELGVMDMFPQTAHVESMAVFRRD
jgi:23S rRNA (uracil1939-C5)-methyltransferase